MELGHGARGEARPRLNGRGMKWGSHSATVRGPCTVAFALTVVLAACTSTAPPQVPPVRVAEPAEVAGCARIGTMTGVPGLYGALAAQGIADARRVVLEGAAEQGANTVVFDRIDPGTTVTEVTAATYRC